MVEYVIIVALVAVASIAVFQLFGQVIRSQTAAMAHELAGEDGTRFSEVAGGAAACRSAVSSEKLTVLHWQR